MILCEIVNDFVLCLYNKRHVLHSFFRPFASWTQHKSVDLQGYTTVCTKRDDADF